jgi:hypothetical protein
MKLRAGWTDADRANMVQTLDQAQHRGRLCCFRYLTQPDEPAPTRFRAALRQSASRLPWFTDRYHAGADWRPIAWWIHDHLPYSQLQFFPKLAAFNIGWHERPRRRIDSFIAPKGCLTRPGMANHEGSHAEFYSGFPRLRGG